MIYREELIEDIELEINSLVIDIETTGFSSKNNHISMIGYILFDDYEQKFLLKQLFCESREDEKVILTKFKDDIKNSHNLISFNGKRFDIPFIQNRLNINRIDFNLSDISQIDLYLYLKNNSEFTQIESCGQKALETKFGLKRPFEMDGKEAIRAYRKYQREKDDSILDKIFIYNKLDIIYLSKLMSIYYEGESSKTIKLKIGDSDIELLIKDMKIVKDIMKIYIVSNRKIIDYEIEFRNKSYNLNWIDRDLEIDIYITKGLIRRDQIGYCFNYSEIAEEISDNSEYNLKKGLLVLKDDNLYIDNLKRSIEAIVEHSIQKTIPSMHKKKTI